MVIYRYDPNDWITLVARQVSEINETIGYYKQKGEAFGPKSLKEALKEVDQVVIPSHFPMCVPKHYIELNAEGIIFCINANAVGYMESLSKRLETLKRGGLYCVQPGPGLGWFYVPEDAMRMLKDFDWKSLDSKVFDWLLERESRRIQIAESSPHIMGVGEVNFLEL